ncbi:IS200/IS605 family transposase [Fervidobacterium islandicum]|uniref:IS200/IS605 family transposase n=2 Tax=Fervidobacterium TaxID=2422 RepID=A0AAI8CL53_FERIS|nr:IS200/IS605 family transposase [Fervidobacterium islandicum]QAV34000.1 IS200/IS605 family transposase [Fervidobacterium changbaicum]
MQYHIVWCVKYRHKILTGDIERKLIDILYEIAKEQGVTVLALQASLDHVHILVDASPQVYIPNLVKALKGVSARRLFQAFPELKTRLWGGHFWNPSYFVVSVGNNVEEKVRQYILSQKERS